MLLAEACLVAGHYDTATPIEDIDARTFPTVALDASPPLSANTFGLSERIRFTFRRQDFIQNPLAPEHAQKVPVWFKCTVSLTRCQYRSEFASAIYALVWMLLLESYDRAKPSKEHRMFWKVYTGELFDPTMWKGSAGKRTEETPHPEGKTHPVPIPGIDSLDALADKCRDAFQHHADMPFLDTMGHVTDTSLLRLDDADSLEEACSTLQTCTAKDKRPTQSPLCTPKEIKRRGN